MKIPAFKQLIKDNSFVLITLFVAYVVNYLLNVFLARHLSPPDYGDLAVVLRLLTFLTPFSLLGTELASLRYLPRYVKEKEWSPFKGYLRWSHRLFLVTFLIIIVIAFLLVLLVFQLDYFGIKTIDSYHPFIFAVWLIPLYAYTYLQSSILQSLSRYTRSVIFTSLGFPVLLMLILVILLTWIDKLSVYHVLFCMGIATLLIIGIQTISIKRMLPKEIQQHPVKYDKNRWFRASLTLLQSSITYAGFNALNIVMLEILGRSEHEVAEFAVISTITTFIALVSSSINIVTSPIVSAHRNEAPQLQPLLHKANILKLTLGIVIFLLIIFGGRFFLAHFGTHYDDPSIYTYLIVRTAIFFIGYVILGLASQVLFYSRHVMKSIKLSYLQVAITLILEVILIPFYGIWGAIIGSGVGLIVYRLWAAILVRRLIGLRTSFLI